MSPDEHPETRGTEESCKNKQGRGNFSLCKYGAWELWGVFCGQVQVSGRQGVSGGLGDASEKALVSLAL